MIRAQLTHTKQGGHHHPTNGYMAWAMPMPTGHDQSRLGLTSCWQHCLTNKTCLSLNRLPNGRVNMESSRMPTTHSTIRTSKSWRPWSTKSYVSLCPNRWVHTITHQFASIKYSPKAPSSNERSHTQQMSSCQHSATGTNLLATNYSTRLVKCDSFEKFQFSCFPESSKATWANRMECQVCPRFTW